MSNYWDSCNPNFEEFINFNPERTINHIFRFEIVEIHESGMWWWKKHYYSVRIWATNINDEEKSKFMLAEKTKWEEKGWWWKTNFSGEYGLIPESDYDYRSSEERLIRRKTFLSKGHKLVFAYKGESLAREAVQNIQSFISEKKIIVETKLQSQKNKEALQQAHQNAKSQGIHLDPAKYTDLKAYLADLEKLKAKNQEQINTLKITPEEHAASIARLQQIQAELEKRKKLAQELEQTQIFEQIAQQKHDLELTNRAIEEKAAAVKQAKDNNETAKAKQLNAEYLELKRKQGALLAFIENLEQNAQYNTFIRFDSLEQLYSPDYQWKTQDSEVLVEKYQPTTWDKVSPYVNWGLGISAIVLGIWLVWRYFFGEVRG